MPRTGRPRLTEADLRARISAYCDRYGVRPAADGLPPFPTGRRETPQHREWIGVYKAHDRLVRRGRGQCQRCAEPAAPGSVFCEAHRTAGPAGGAAGLEGRRRLLSAQRSRCPICSKKIGLSAVLDHGPADGDRRALLHPACSRLVALAEPSGPEVLDRLRAYLWPKSRARSEP